MDIPRMLAISPPIPIDHQVALKTWRAYRIANGYSADVRLLTEPTGNAKLNKSGRLDYGLSLAPARTSGYNACPWSTPICRAGCVAFAGRGTGPAGRSGHTITEARILKTRFLVEERDAFCTLVRDELANIVKRQRSIARKKHKKFRAVACRLNVFSDIPWEKVAPWMLIPEVKFYDYSKGWHRVTPANYHLCYSASENTSDADVVAKCATGATVAVVFNARYRPNETTHGALPVTFQGIQVVDGDKMDTRYDDVPGQVIGLRAKGSMRASGGGMVRDAATQ